MIIVRDLAGNILCYLFTRQQRDQFDKTAPADMRFSLTFQHIGPPSFGRDPSKPAN